MTAKQESHLLIMITITNRNSCYKWIKTMTKHEKQTTHPFTVRSQKN